MRPVVHLHIPRTGGTTIRRALRAVYGPNLYRLGNHEDPAAAAGSQALTGHTTFGAGEAAGMDDPVYLTTLRDPADRLLSLYHYLRTEVPNRWAAMVEAMSFDEFVRQERDDWPWLDNDQTRRISGLGAIPYGVDGNDLQRAIDNMEAFPVVGLTERMSETIRRWAAIVGWPFVPDLGRHNAGVGVPTAAEADPDTMGVIRKRQRFDYELLEHATGRDWA